MRVGFLVSRFPSLSETFVVNQITGLMDLGVDIDILPVTEGIYDGAHTEVADYSLRDRVFASPTVRNRRQLVSSVLRGAFSNHANLRRVLRMVGRKPEILFYPSWQLIADVLWRGQRYDQCDVLCCHHGPQGLRALRLRDAGVARGPIVTFFHGYDISGYLEKHGTDVYNTLFEKGEVFLTISERWKRRLLEIGCPKEKIRVHRMGVDLRKFEYNDRRISLNDKINIVTVGRLTEKKGIKYAIRAISEIKKKGYDVTYRVIGSGEEQAALRQLVDRLDINESVTLVGRLRQQEVVNVLRDSDLFILPSVTAKDGDQEGVPVALMEAMAMGLPVISTWHSGIPELVQHEENGMLVQERESHELAVAIARVIDDSELYEKIARNGRTTVENRFSVQSLNRELKQLFTGIIDQNGSKRND